MMETKLHDACPHLPQASTAPDFQVRQRDGTSDIVGTERPADDAGGNGGFDGEGGGGGGGGQGPCGSGSNSDRRRICKSVVVQGRRKQVCRLVKVPGGGGCK